MKQSLSSVSKKIEITLDDILDDNAKIAFDKWMKSKSS